MAPRTGHPRRRTTTGVAPRRISVFTEGSKTEPGYIKHWHRLHRDRVQVLVWDGLGAPIQVVERAVETKKRETREARRGRGSASDEYWCVIDVDRHPHVDRAVEKAQANSVAIAVSNPCIELWFVLHFQDHTAHIKTETAQDISQRELKCGKALNQDALQRLAERYLDAKTRAENLERKHRDDGNPPRWNPSSSVWTLIDQIKQ